MLRDLRTITTSIQLPIVINRSFYLTGGNERPYAVADLRGCIVKSGMVVAGESVDLMDLERGVYVLRVKGERPLRFGLIK